MMRAYGLWLAATLVLQLAGYADTRSARDLFTILAELTVGVIAVAAWRARAPIAALLGRLRIVGPLRFVLAGLVPAYASEVLFYFASAADMPVGVFLLRTLVWYAGWLAAWWWLQQRHALSAAEVFFLGGLNGFIVEGLILRTVPLSLLALVLYPLVASLYGAVLLVPYALRETSAGPRVAVPVTRKLAWSLLPLLAFLPGLAWMALVQLVFGVG